MMNNLKMIFVLITLLFSGQAWSDGDWYWKGGVQALQRAYSGSDYYDNLTGLGAYVAADYLEQATLIMGYNYNNRQYNSGLTSTPGEMKENIVFFGTSGNFYPDKIPGKLTLRMDGYVGQDKYSSFTVTVPGPMGGSTKKVSIKDDFTVLNPAIAFLNHTKTFYLDLGFAHSTYSSGDSANYNINITHPKKNTIPGGSTTDDITVTQWTPTVGFGFNQTADWLQFRTFLINFSSSNRVDFIDSTIALETKWIHWFSSDAVLGLHSAGLNLLIGERIYAVDSDSYSLYNLADMQKTSVAMNASWKFGKQLGLLVQGGYENYEDIVINNSYNSTYLFAQLSQTW